MEPPRNLTSPWFLAYSKNCVLLKTKDHQAVDAPTCALGFLAGNAMPARLRVPTHSEAHNDGMSHCVPNSRICGHTAVVAVSLRSILWGVEMLLETKLQGRHWLVKEVTQELWTRVPHGILRVCLFHKCKILYLTFLWCHPASLSHPCSRYKMAHGG